MVAAGEDISRQGNRLWRLEATTRQHSYAHHGHVPDTDHTDLKPRCMSPVTVAKGRVNLPLHWRQAVFRQDTTTTPHRTNTTHDIVATVVIPKVVHFLTCTSPGIYPRKRLFGLSK